MYKTLLTLYDQTVIAKVYQEATKSLVIDCSHMPVSCGLSGPWACKTVSPFLVQPVISGPTMLSMCHDCAPSLSPTLEVIMAILEFLPPWESVFTFSHSLGGTLKT